MKKHNPTYIDLNDKIYHKKKKKKTSLVGALIECGVTKFKKESNSSSKFKLM
jgi:hypothetical protein